MKIRVKLEVSQEHDVTTFDLADIYDGTEEEWGKLSDSEKKVLIDQCVDELPEQPYWVIDDWDEL